MLLAYLLAQTLQNGVVDDSALLPPAIAAIRSAIPTAEQDPSRPQFHFRAPARWMNDPNGPIYTQGWYHVFYQLNPYGDDWGHMHWGHARSRDLVDWEHLPIALGPAKSQGEDHVFSGSTYLKQDGTPEIFYTSISDKRPPHQWAAAPLDKDLLTWARPKIQVDVPTPPNVGEWRDPFLFDLGDKTYMLTGGNIDRKGIVALHRALDPGLKKWAWASSSSTRPRTTSSAPISPRSAASGFCWSRSSGGSSGSRGRSISRR